MDFRNVTPELVLPRTAATTEKGVSFFDNRNIGTQFPGPDGRHEAGDTAADAQNIYFNIFFF
jgi:hypothetical protein